MHDRAELVSALWILALRPTQYLTLLLQHGAWAFASLPSRQRRLFLRWNTPFAADPHRSRSGPGRLLPCAGKARGGNSCRLRRAAADWLVQSRPCLTPRPGGSGSWCGLSRVSSSAGGICLPWACHGR